MTTFPAINASLSDAVYIPVTFLLMLWFFKASLRFYRAIRIREAILTDRLVAIEGLGSYLSYFDGATRPHVHAIVHTRQAKPPEPMKSISVPYVLYKSQIITSAGKDTFYLKFQFSSPTPIKVFVMTNFRYGSWQRFLGNQLAKHLSANSLAKAVASGKIDVAQFLRSNIFTGSEKPNNTQRSNTSGNVTAISCSHLDQNDICDNDVYTQDLTAGVSSSTVQIFPKIAQYRDDAARQPDALKAWLSELRICALICPLSTDGLVSALQGGISTSPRPAGVVSLAPARGANTETPHANLRVAERVPDGQSYELIDTNAHPIVDVNSSFESGEGAEVAQAVLFSCQASPEALDLLFPKATSDTGDLETGYHPLVSAPVVRSADLSVEAIALDSSAQHYSLQEIYGLHARNPLQAIGDQSAESAKPPESANASKTALAMSVGGDWVREECVVCLMEQKCVALLPCRHLCVCTSCLIYVDKCPVCRAFFQEYVVIQGPTSSGAPESQASLDNHATLPTPRT